MRSLYAVSKQTRRMLEIIIPGLSWLLITMPSGFRSVTRLLLPISSSPLTSTGFINHLPWLYTRFVPILRLLHIKVDWRSQAAKEPGFKEVYHAIIIPEHNEPSTSSSDARKSYQAGLPTEQAYRRSRNRRQRSARPGNREAFSSRNSVYIRQIPSHPPRPAFRGSCRQIIQHGLGSRQIIQSTENLEHTDECNNCHIVRCGCAPPSKVFLRSNLQLPH